MAPHKLDESIALLERFPKSLQLLLDGLPEVWLDNNEGPDTWTVRDVVRHLAHHERVDWMSRARMILETGEDPAFPPLNRTGFRETGGDLVLSDFLAEFSRLRAGNIAELRSFQLGEADLGRTGRHPALGVVTLSQLLATWVTHDLTHLHQISRVMAYQYRDHVGPWREYLGVIR